MWRWFPKNLIDIRCSPVSSYLEHGCNWSFSCFLSFVILRSSRWIESSLNFLWFVCFGTSIFRYEKFRQLFWQIISYPWFCPLILAGIIKSFKMFKNCAKFKCQLSKRLWKILALIHRNSSVLRINELLHICVFPQSLYTWSKSDSKFQSSCDRMGKILQKSWTLKSFQLKKAYRKVVNRK